MKSKFSLLGIIAAVVIGLTAVFIGCTKEDVNAVVNYYGKVNYINTSTPFPDLEVKVTDGNNTHCLTHTDAEGKFSLMVKVDEINGNYYVLVGDSTCEPKKVALPGFGQPEIDLGTIEIEGPSMPTVTTNAVKDVKADAAVTGGNVTSDGRLTVTARGVCYGKEAYPTIDGLHTTDGTGKGKFTSNLKELEYNTIYYARAYATNKMGTAYGEQVKFITAEGVAVVITDSVYNITANSAKCKAHVVSDGGFSVTKRGVCWSTKADPTIDDKITEEGSGLGEYTNTLKDLVENTKYYVRAYAINSTTTSYGEQIIITTLDGMPVVVTDSITSIAATGFTAYGNVVSDCDIPVTARGFCYATTQYPTIEDAYTTIGKGIGKYQGNIKNLAISTTYYVRAYATNATGTAYSEQIKITTADGLPIVKTLEASSATATSITASGEVMDNGGFEVTERGVCYSTSNLTPTIENEKTISGKGNGKYTVTMTELTNSTAYYVRAYATNANGTAYGEIIKVVTKSGLPVVNTIFIGENVTETTAVSGGKVTDDGGYAVTARGVCWNTVPYPTINDNKTTDGTGMGSYSSQISGIDLKSSQTYYVRAYATNQNGTAYGDELVVNQQNLEYKNLPRLEVDDYIYVFYHDIGEMFYDDAVEAVSSMTFAGYDDWMLVPTSEQMRYIMVTMTEGWKDLWGNPITVYTKENPAPSTNVGASGYYWTSDNSCIDGYQSSVQITCEELYDWDTYTQYYAHSAAPHCSQVISNRDRVRPVRRYKKF